MADSQQKPRTPVTDDAQVGGHGGDALLFEDGRVLKRTTYPKELAFFRAVEAGDVPAGLTPAFFGTVTRDGREYIAMGDVTAGFARPCVLDLKMGTRTWHAECDEAKRQAHMDQDAKCTTHKYGFRFAGMKTYSLEEDGAAVRYDRKYAWDALDDAMMLEALASFLVNAGDDARRAAIVRAFAERVARVAAFFREKGGWDIVASSLLFVYDADAASPAQPSVHMIDFAHATRLPAGAWDGGYLFGCTELLRLFAALADKLEGK